MSGCSQKKWSHNREKWSKLHFFRFWVYDHFSDHFWICGQRFMSAAPTRKQTLNCLSLTPSPGSQVDSLRTQVTFYPPYKFKHRAWHIEKPWVGCSWDTSNSKSAKTTILEFQKMIPFEGRCKSRLKISREVASLWGILPIGDLPGPWINLQLPPS